MRFEVPQFIEIEDKLFGPLTFKQFIYLAGGAGISVVIYLSPLPLFIGAFLILPIAIFAMALAFYKFNNQPFINLVENMFNYGIRTKLYTWKKREKPVEQAVEEIIDPTATVAVPRLSDSKLKDLAWSLDVEERRRSGEVL